MSKVASVELPDHVVRAFEDRVAALFPALNHNDARFMVRVLCETWTEGALHVLGVSVRRDPL